MLNHIDASEGLIQKEIAERTGKDKPTTTRILDHLESKGLVYKKTGLQDRRSYIVYSTDRGKELIRDTIGIEQGVTEEVKSCMTEEEYSLFMGLLERINHHVSKELDKRE
ncbi:Transcriptional regulator SlyA [compost metagenome]